MTCLIALALLQSTGLDTPVTIETKDALVRSVLADISKQCHVTCKFAPLYENVKVTVFAEHVPAKSLLERIGSALGFEGALRSGIYYFAPTAETKAGAEYLIAEGNYRNQLIAQKLVALAKLTLQPYGSHPESHAVPVDKKLDDGTVDPQVWASERIAQPGYYALGMAYRCSTMSWSIFAPIPAVSDPGKDPTGAFYVEKPEEVPVPETYIDGNSQSLEGTLIAYGFLNSTGEIKVCVLHGTPLQNEPLLDHPFLFATPPKALKKFKFAQALDKWAMKVDDLPKEMLDKPGKPTAREKDPGYFDGRISLSEKLERLHLQTGIPIVATSFRTPALDQNIDDVDSVRDTLATLVAKEKCFIRDEDGFLLVRHPAYWLLRASEPPEDVIRAYEKVAESRPLTIGEYADLALAIGQNVDSGASLNPEPGSIPHCYDRLINQRGLLLRFDGGPLATAYPALYFLGAFNAAGRAKILAGAVWDSYQPQMVTSVSAFRDIEPGRIKRGNGPLGPIVGYWDMSQVRVSRRVLNGDWNLYADYVAAASPIFDATTSLRFLTRTEAGIDKQGRLIAMMKGSDLEDIASLNELDVRARLIEVKTLDPRNYVFDVGFAGDIVATYRASIDWKPKPR
ncbi:MAG TPA: hypothetical protein VHE55_00830 [Fimbriimonadaceae bacterium]|nr:hypothetical protein [Fimbriimonadaceae bacterium]